MGRPSDKEVAAKAKAQRLNTTAIPTNFFLMCRPELVRDEHVAQYLRTFCGKQAVLLEYEVDPRTFIETYFNAGTGDHGTSSTTLVHVWFYYPGFPAIQT